MSSNRQREEVIFRTTISKDQFLCNDLTLLKNAGRDRHWPSAAELDIPNGSWSDMWNGSYKAYEDSRMIEKGYRLALSVRIFAPIPMTTRQQNMWWSCCIVGQLLAITIRFLLPAWEALPGRLAYPKGHLQAWVDDAGSILNCCWRILAVAHSGVIRFSNIFRDMDTRLTWQSSLGPMKTRHEAIMSWLCFPLGVNDRFVSQNSSPNGRNA